MYFFILNGVKIKITQNIDLHLPIKVTGVLRCARFWST